MKKYLTAIVIAMLLTTTVFGAQISKKIDVVFNAITIEVNGKKVEADNIVHKGTTYVPLRVISEELGNQVIWDEESKTAQINDINIKEEDPIITITMENGDEIELELYPDQAPITVKNFVSLINQGFYEGLTFHRIIPGFMIQGGDPSGDGSGGSGHMIKGEFIKNGVQNDIAHDRGTLAMARSANPNSASSQFFIVVEDSPHLNGDYAGFGKVTQGMDVVDKIVASPTDQNDKPLSDQIIKKITVK